MDYLEEVVSRLAAAETFGYHAGWEQATEPVALAAMALVTHHRETAALPLLAWLMDRQRIDGSVGVDGEQPHPAWPTAWATLAWHFASASSIADSRFAAAAKRACAWLLSVQGMMIDQADTLGHDPTIKGWPWVEGTHAWLEPTAMSLLALRHTGYDHHERSHAAVNLLFDRLLPDGGCNYGNTFVLGQQLRPHLEPTGLCLLALAGQADVRGRVAKSIAFLEQELGSETTTISLAYGLLGLAAQGHWPAGADQWLASASRRTLARDPAPYKLALVALAALGESCPLNPGRQLVTS
ncbi:MAG TPA: hypothetical protein VHV08_10935 [Pirellulales bacterium]|jgi:hypothetical protein|nr:hypothetical protein [Pirellulales bacterium]